MKNTGFYWEIKDVLTQFVAAFDEIFIERYNKDRSPQETIEVRYVFAPKERVIYDIVNKAQNITLPAVSVNITGISRDNSRVFNKLESTFVPGMPDQTGPRAAKIPAPVPVNIEVSMSIISKYMTDVDQIISNFVPYCDPYIIISWPVPSAFGTAETLEIRTEVLWSGNISITNPIDITNDKYRITCDTSFTIKAWLFKEAVDTQAIIYKVDNNFTQVRNVDQLRYYEDYKPLSGYETTEVITVSALPSVTNLFYSLTGATIPVYNTPITIRRNNPNMFIVYGKNFDYNNTFYLSSGTPNFYKDFTEIKTPKSPTISAYDITNFVSVLNNNIYTLNIPTCALSAQGAFTIVTANSAGWAATDSGLAVNVD
jgi:hypothetical protein